MNAPCQGATHSSRGWSGRTLSPSPLQPRSLPLPSPQQAASQGANREAKSWFAEPQPQNHKAECLGGAGLMLREDSFVTPGGQVKSWRLVTQHFPSPSTLLPVSWFLSLLVPRGRVWRAWPLDASQRREECLWRAGFHTALVPRSVIRAVMIRGLISFLPLKSDFPSSGFCSLSCAHLGDTWTRQVSRLMRLFYFYVRPFLPQVYWQASIFLAESGVGSRATDSRFKA